MTYSNYNALLFKRRGSILEVTMNCPEKLNAVNEEMHGELARVFVDISNDPECDIAILTGAGRAFSAGGDFVWFQKLIDDPTSFEATAREGKQIIHSLLDCQKPIIAKVNGHASGLGATIALFCDVIFAAETAKISDPHVCAGLTAGDGGAVIWPQLIGYARAKEYLLTGDAVIATDAAKMGLINHAVPSEELDHRVAEFADRLASGATKSIRWTKMSVNIGLKQLASSILDTSFAYETLSNISDDHQEAVTAFLEKRKPVFTGK